MLAASSTYAGQVELSVEGRVGGDSNVFRVSDDETDDGTFDISPRLGVRDENEDLDYAFDYQPTYRSFFKTSGIDGVDHLANGRVGWDISSIDQIRASGSYYNGRQFLFGSQGSGSGSTFTVDDRERIRIADAQLGYRRLLSPRLSLGADGYFDDFDASGTNIQSQTDSRAYTGRISARYALDPRAEVGLSVSGRRRENRAVGQFRVSTRTDVWDVLASVSYALTPTLSASVEAGPSFIRQQQVPGGARDPSSPECFTPPDFQCARYGHDEDDDVNLFAAASVKKEWQTSDLTLSYVRTEARSGNTASSSSIADQVEVSGNRRLSDRWTVRALAGWDQYEQIVSQQGAAGDFKLTNYRATGTVEFSLTSRVLLLGQYTYAYQENELDQPDVTDELDVHFGFVGLRYTFEPLAF